MSVVRPVMTMSAPPLRIAGPPHLTGLSGVASARQLMGVASFLVPRELIEGAVEVQVQDI